MVNKTLLCSVLGLPSYKVKNIVISDNMVQYIFRGETREINLYEFAHECKEFIYEITAYGDDDGDFIMSATKVDGQGTFAVAWLAPSDERYTDTAYIEHMVTADSEPEAIIEVANWKLKKQIKRRKVN